MVVYAPGESESYRKSASSYAGSDGEVRGSQSSRKNSTLRAVGPAHLLFLGFVRFSSGLLTYLLVCSGPIVESSSPKKQNLLLAPSFSGNFLILRFMIGSEKFFSASSY